MIDSLANLNTTACSLKASLPNLSHNVRRWSQKRNQSPPMPPKEMVM